MAEWAYRNGLHEPNVTMVFREEYRVDAEGRRYRATHAAMEKRGAHSISLWADMDDPNARTRTAGSVLRPAPQSDRR